MPLRGRRHQRQPLRHHAQLDGRRITRPPRLFLGAASNPFAPPLDWRPQRLAKKIEAGADFIQSQYCFDVPRFEAFMARVRDMGLHEEAFFLVGVGPLRSERAAEFMWPRVPGVHIPDAVVSRLKGVPKKNQREEGKRICVETIQRVREIEGVKGVHIMAYRQEEWVAEIVEEAGLLARQRLPAAPQDGRRRGPRRCAGRGRAARHVGRRRDEATPETRHEESQGE